MVEHGSTDVGMQSFYQDIELNTQKGQIGFWKFSMRLVARDSSILPMPCPHYKISKRLASCLGLK